MEKVDIIVLGAGPAGCAASIRARQAGLSVILFEANPQPKMTPGETLHPGVEPLLKQLGVLDRVLQAGFPRHRGIWLERGGSPQFVPYGEDKNGRWLGFQTDRRKLHQIFQQTAVDLGVRLIRGTRPNAVIVEENRVIGVMVGDRPFYATWTADATGRSAWLARKLEIPAVICSPPLGVRFGWSDEESADFGGQPSLTFCDDGWNWQAPVGENRTAWVKLRIGTGDRSPQGVNLSWQWRSKCAGYGFFLLGDAASTLDPSSSHGVLTALMSGIFFGHLVEGCHRKNVSETFVIEAYRKWLCLQFKQDEKLLRQQYLESPAGQRFIKQAFSL